MLGIQSFKVKRNFDDRIRCVQGALFVPPRGDSGEVLLRCRGAATANNRQPIEIGRQHAVAGVGEREDTLDELTDRPGRLQVEKCPRAFAMLVDNAGLGEQVEVPRDPGLRHAQDVGEVGDRQFAVLQEHRDPQPCLFIECPEHIQQSWQGQVHETLYNDIYI